jgi:glucose-6-phosphate 1-dehydrogenase
VIKLDPAPGVRLLLDGRKGDEMAPHQMSLDVDFSGEGMDGPTPYEVLLQAAMQGNDKRFTRQDGVEETWRIMQPLLDNPSPIHSYAPETWGPAAADKLMSGHGRWHEPWAA